jgi:rubrerythrin
MTKSESNNWGKMTTLDACVKVEETCAAIYYSLADTFAESPKISSLWTKMALEEERHAEEFKSIRAIHCSNFGCSDSENYIIKMMLDNIEAIENDFKIKAPTYRDALMTALVLEKSVEKYHLEASRLVLEPELSRLLDVMVEHSRAHMDLIKIATDSIEQSDC